MRNPKFARPIAAALIATSALSLGACATNRSKGDLPYVARDVGTLYTAAKDRLDRRQYKLAAQLFDEVERQHPYSVWARRAQLMSAFSYYMDHDYTNAIQSAQRFLSLHPGNRDAPYAYYLVSLSYYEQISDVTRDQKITQQALDALGELTRRYPDTRYAADARLKIDLVRDHLAGKEMEIGRFYEKRGQWLAASMRFTHVVNDYQTTTHTPEALMRLTETYLALGVPMQAERSAAVLGANYPGSPYYERAYKLMQEHKATPLPAATPGSIIPVSHPNTAIPGNPAPGLPGANGTVPTTTPPTPATTGTTVPTPPTPVTGEPTGAGDSPPPGG